MKNDVPIGEPINGFFANTSHFKQNQAEWRKNSWALEFISFWTEKHKVYLKVLKQKLKRP